jgi:hypothetical protein
MEDTSLLLARVRRLIARLVYIYLIPGIVFPQRAHENHGDEPDQEDDHHERVEDREPVNLQVQGTMLYMFKKLLCPWLAVACNWVT